MKIEMGNDSRLETKDIKGKTKLNKNRGKRRKG